MNKARAAGGALVIVLVATLSTQAVVSWSVLALSAIAPLVAESVGLPAVVIGYQIAIVYATGMVISLLSGALVSHFGGCGVSQIALLCCVAGCAVATAPGTPAIILASMAIGAAHGLTNPAAAQLLARYTNARNRGLVFSIKQTGVPIGGIAAGIVTPAIAVAFGWKAAVLAIAPLALLLAASMIRVRPRWDGEKPKDTPPGSLFLRGATSAWRSPGLPALCLCSFCFAGIQLCLLAFIVNFSVFELGFGAILGGTLLAVVQAAGVVGRISWGLIADRIQSNGACLVVIGILAAAAAFGFSLLGPETPRWIVFGLAILFGLTAVGWNGLAVAEIVRVSPTELIATASGIGNIAAFGGVLVFPSLFVSVYGWLGSYALTYAFLVAPALIGAAAGLAMTGGRARA
ncbi:MAG: MFS transporter [Salinarimonadaceae bacterium]|nr:MAG: MFS transporter [Salinarimonadaceae bacterium]